MSLELLLKMSYYIRIYLSDTKNARELRREKLTVLRITEIDIGITKRSSPSLIPTNPNGDNLSDLVEEIVELAVVDGGIEIADVE